MWKTALILASLIFAFFTSGPLPAALAKEEPLPEAKVLEGHMASSSGHLASIANNHPVSVFENDIERIYAVMRLEKVPRDTRIKYLWFFRDQIVHEATLPVKANQIRAQSGLLINPKWIGNWKVDVTSGDGTLLYSIPFVVHRKPESIQASSPAPVVPEIPGEETPVSVSTSGESATVP